MKKLNYLILPELSLIIEYYSGAFHADELIDFKRKIGMDEKYDPNYNVISDIRELSFLFEIDEVQKYMEFIAKNKRYIGARKTAMITSTPSQVVTSLKFNLLKTNLPIVLDVFSIPETAYAFIGLSSDDAEMVDNLLDKLRNEF
ncbi:hypothetical protein E9993_16130 [Labilibacter sediminis]|nr:hypothetical protein E9993_16130 [Labilibacter sediminis]